MGEGTLNLMVRWKWRNLKDWHEVTYIEMIKKISGKTITSTKVMLKGRSQKAGVLGVL